MESLSSATKLSTHDSKKAIYWRIATRYSEQLKFIPALAMVGPSGSGKTTTMEGLSRLPGESSPIYACSTLTMANCRDLLAEWKDKLFCADEADDLKPEVKFLFMARSNRDMAVINYKEAVSQNKYKQATADIFGPTIIHHRNEIEDAAQSSRSIQIFTRFEDGPFPPFEPDLEALAAITLDMANVPVYGGRAYTTWAPLLHVARQLGDEAFIAEVEAEIELQKEMLRSKAEFDNASLVLGKVIEVIASRALEHRWDRIEIDYLIGQQLRYDFPNLTPMVIGMTLRTLGFFTERRGGKLWLYPDRASLEIAARKRAYRDADLDFLLGLEGAGHRANFEAYMQAKQATSL